MVWLLKNLFHFQPIVPFLVFFPSILSLKTECDLELLSLHLVAATVRFLLAFSSNSCTYNYGIIGINMVITKTTNDNSTSEYIFELFKQKRNEIKVHCIIKYPCWQELKTLLTWRVWSRDVSGHVTCLVTWRVWSRDVFGHVTCLVTRRVWSRDTHIVTVLYNNRLYICYFNFTRLLVDKLYYNLLVRAGIESHLTQWIMMSKLLVDI